MNREEMTKRTGITGMIGMTKRNDWDDQHDKDDKDDQDAWNDCDSLVVLSLTFATQGFSSVLE